MSTRLWYVAFNKKATREAPGPDNAWTVYAFPNKFERDDFDCHVHVNKSKDIPKYINSDKWKLVKNDNLPMYAVGEVITDE